MGTTYDDERTAELARHRDHWTTIILEEQSNGEWLATQGGVAVEGHGDTAAEAAANYCRKIDENDD